MPSTPTYALPYPAAGDPADVPLDMQELAERIELVFPGKEFAYAQITADLNVPVVAEASAVTVVTAPAVTFDGTPILVEFFAQQVSVPINSSLLIHLWDGSTNLGFWGQFQNPVTAGGGGTIVSAMLQRRLTPSAGSHTYIVKAWAAGGAGVIGAGAGGAPSTKSPAFVRITRV